MTINELANSWLALVGSAVWLIALLMSVVGFIFSRLDIPINFGLARLWDWIDRARNLKYSPATMCWFVARAVRNVAGYVWHVILLCSLIFAIAPQSILERSIPHSAAATVEIPTVTDFQRLLLYLIPATSFLAYLLSKGMRWIQENNVADTRSGRIVVWSILIAVASSALAACVTALYTAVQFHGPIAIGFMPETANLIVNKYQELTVWEVLAFGVSSFAIYPIPIMAAAALPVVSLYLVMIVFMTPFLFVSDDEREEISERLEENRFFNGLQKLLNWSLRPVDFLVPALPGAFASVIFTIGALLVGNLIQSEKVDVTVQVLASNAVFDGLTVFGTIFILTWASVQHRLRGLVARYVALKRVLELVPGDKGEEWFSLLRRLELDGDVSEAHVLFALARTFEMIIDEVGEKRFAKIDEGLRPRSPTNSAADLGNRAIEKEREWFPMVMEFLERSGSRVLPGFVGDFLFAALLAFGALYFSFVGTPGSLRFNDLWHIFIGGFDGSKFTQLGPLFWVMHTTFLPTAILWLMVLLVYFSAFVLSPSANAIAQWGRATTRIPISNVTTALFKTGTFLMVAATFWFALSNLI